MTGSKYKSEGSFVLERGGSSRAQLRKMLFVWQFGLNSLARKRKTTRLDVTLLSLNEEREEDKFKSTDERLAPL